MSGPQDAVQRDSEALADSQGSQPMNIIPDCPPDIVAWAYDCIQNPGRYGADARDVQMIADLLAHLAADR